MRISDWLLLVLLSVLWGATFLFIAIANPEVPPFTLVLGRVGLAALAPMPMVLLAGLRRAHRRKPGLTPGHNVGAGLDWECVGVWGQTRRV